MLLLITIAVVFIVALILNSESLKYFLYIRKIPSPITIPFIGDVVLLTKHNFNFIRALGLMEKRNGDIFRIWGGCVIVFISRPEDLEVLCSAPIQDRGPFVAGLAETLGSNSLLTAEGPIAKEIRKSFLRTFSNSSQYIVFKNFGLVAKRLLNDFESKEGKFFKCAEMLKKTTLDAIIATGISGSIDDYADVKNSVMNDLDEFTLLMINRGLSPLHKVNILYKYVFGAKKLYKVYDNMHKVLATQFCEIKRNEFLEMKSTGSEIPNQFIYNVLRENPNISDRDLGVEIMTLLGAALDTSAVTASYILVLLAMHPKHQQLVYEETVRANKELNGEAMDENSIEKYAYLNLVIKEAMRLFPPVPGLPRILREDLKFRGYLVPKGATVFGSVLTTHRDPMIFKNPNVFDPDRFLPENFEKLPKFAYLPFGGGSRSCPGYRYGVQSATYLVATIVLKYKLFTPYKTIEELDENVVMSITLNDKEGFPIRIEKRRG